MPRFDKLPFPEFTGLSGAEVQQSRAMHGANVNEVKSKSLRAWLADVLKEPMLLLLICASILYFAGGNAGDGFFMLASILFVAGISWFQQNRSKRALDALKAFTETSCTVIRDGTRQQIKPGELVMDDLLMVEEGMTIPADGLIVYASDLSVDESILTGESMPVFKNDHDDRKIYQGTAVNTGMAICKVTGIGGSTALGKIGKSLAGVEGVKTPMQVKIADFVRKMTLVGLAFFLVVWGINFARTHLITDSLLRALTLAMSILPEEIPVAFSTFIALGAWRLMKLGIIVKQPKAIETLGSATVICSDKTGTLTENRMTLVKVYDLQTNHVHDLSNNDLSATATEVIRTAMWASEPVPFDPMEKSLHHAYEKFFKDERPAYRLVHEYPLSGQPPLMTHVFENMQGTRIIAAKGAPEALLKLARLSEAERARGHAALEALTAEGYRVLAVGHSPDTTVSLPDRQEALAFVLLGLVAFNDPPRKNVGDILRQFYAAGIQVKIITGDNTITTQTIARQIGFRDGDHVLNGSQVMALDDEGLRNAVGTINLFTRMFPDAKLRVLKSLQARGEIVAMTGDGVNDAPALKGAHIGVAMGMRGSEVAKEASSLVLSDDDLGRIVDAIAMGRKIHDNLKKAIRYIISIHIPIILTVFVPLVAGWVYPHILSPVHVIFLELIMGPTCSIIYENEPAEPDSMTQRPRPLTKSFFTWKELSTSVLQGLAITAGVLGMYAFSVQSGLDEPATRTLVFIALISANILLTLVNRSFYHSLATTLRYRNNLIPTILSITILLTVAMVFIPAVSHFFEFGEVTLRQALVGIGAGCVSVIWFEGVKAFKRVRATKPG